MSVMLEDITATFKQNVITLRVVSRAFAMEPCQEMVWCARVSRILNSRNDVSQSIINFFFIMFTIQIIILDH